MALGNHAVQREVAVPAEKTWDKGKDEDSKYSGRGRNPVR
jgi:hypothetical protein